MLVNELFDEIPLTDGDVIPMELKRLLREELDIARDWDRTEHLLCSCIDQLPECLELQIALYKMYAYANHFDKAMALINNVLAVAARKVGFDPDWHNLTPETIDWSNASGDVRLYLYTMKATGFVSLRQGNFDRAVAVLAKLNELDPLDQVGGSVVREMAERLLEEE